MKISEPVCPSLEIYEHPLLDSLVSLDKLGEYSRITCQPSSGFK
jgi:hypothetical protein